MSGAAAGGGAAATAVAATAIANALKAHGGIIKLDREEFIKILNKAEAPLVAFAEGGFFGKNYQYLSRPKWKATFPRSCLSSTWYGSQASSSYSLREMLANDSTIQGSK